MVVFDVLTFGELKKNDKNIYRLAESEITFMDNKYSLSAVIAFPYDGHFTSFILNYKGEEYIDLLKKIKVIIMMILIRKDILKK